MRPCDEDTVSARRLSSAASLTWRDADNLGRDGGWARCEFGGDYGFHIFNANQDVFGFEVGMNDSTFGVEVIKSEEDLFCDLFDNVGWDTSMLISLDET